LVHVPRFGHLGRAHKRGTTLLRPKPSFNGRSVRLPRKQYQKPVNVPSVPVFPVFRPRISRISSPYFPVFPVFLTASCVVRSSARPNARCSQERRSICANCRSMLSNVLRSLRCFGDINSDIWLVENCGREPNLSAFAHSGSNSSVAECPMSRAVCETRELGHDLLHGLKIFFTSSAPHPSSSRSSDSG
jgi:hypothetical protein